MSISGTEITLDEDVRNSPTDDLRFTGTLAGQQFRASFMMGSDYTKYVCAFRGGTLEGTFSADFTSFDAVETLFWGTPENEAVVRRHWIGTRL